MELAGNINKAVKSYVSTQGILCLESILKFNEAKYITLYTFECEEKSLRDDVTDEERDIIAHEIVEIYYINKTDTLSECLRELVFDDKSKTYQFFETV
jgi:hypothetical protein